MKEIELIIMAMPVVESHVFNNEINLLFNSGFLPNLKTIILTKDNLKFIRYNKE